MNIANPHPRDRPQRPCGQYISWSLKDNGKDGLTPIARLQQFLLKDGGANLEKYLGRKSGSTFKISKVTLINQCRMYFLEQGVERTISRIKTRMNTLIVKQYRNAYDRWAENVEKVSENEKEDFENMLNGLCPNFFQMKQVIGLLKPPLPRVQNNKDNTPLPRAHNNKDNTPLPIAHNNNDNSPLPRAHNRDRPRVLLAKRPREMISPEVPRLIQDTREAQKIRIDSLNTAARRFQEERVAVIPQNNEKEWEMKTKQVKYEALSNTVFQLAKMFEWSEEKTKKELDDKFHQIFN